MKMYEYEFFKFIEKWRKAGRYPAISAWPNSISFGNKFWDSISTLARYTATDKHEYETSFFHVGTEVISTKPLRGSESQVNARHSFQVQYIPNQVKKNYEKRVTIDGNIIQKETVHPDKLPKEIDAGFLFNVHTHPEHFTAAGERTYSFFSDTDINSLLSSGLYMTGLVTDSFWLCGRSDSSVNSIGSVGVEMLMNVTEQAFTDSRYLHDKIQTEMKNWGLVFYNGNLKGTLNRVI